MKAYVFREYVDIDEMTGNVIEKWLEGKPVYVKVEKFDNFNLKRIDEKKKAKKGTLEDLITQIKGASGEGIQEIAETASC